MNISKIAEDCKVHVNTASKYRKIFNSYTENMPDAEAEDFLVKTIKKCTSEKIRAYDYLRSLNGETRFEKKPGKGSEKEKVGLMARFKQETAKLRVEIDDLTQDIYDEQSRLSSENAKLVTRVNQLDGLLSIALQRINALEETSTQRNVSEKLDEILSIISEKRHLLPDWTDVDPAFKPAEMEAQE